MYQCRNCGGNLRFDIPSQRLKCPYCSSDFDCYELEEVVADSGLYQHSSVSGPEDAAAGEEGTYEISVFSCPACGGEIVSSDQSVSEFCTYCGQSVVLERKMRREKRPKKIIPFQKTVEDCRNAYVKKLRGSFFAPGYLKNPDFLEKFRGIYIPYWSYSFYHKGRVKVTGKKEYRSGDYDVTEYYDVTGDVDASYEGIVFDASSSFSDELGESVAPFDPAGFQDFVPSYLSGFYGDVADVSSDIYLDDANVIANDRTLSTISDDPVGGKYTLSESSSVKSMNQKLHTKIGEPEAAMLPIWFLTWRNKDRVAYMTVNGQTGKVAADIPIDLKKYILGSLLFAVPLYFLINTFFFFLPSTILFIAGLFAFITSLIYSEEMHSIDSRDKKEKDRGYQYVQDQIRTRKKREEIEKEKEEKAMEGEMAEEAIPADEDSSDTATTSEETGKKKYAKYSRAYYKEHGYNTKKKGNTEGEKESKEKKSWKRRILNYLTVASCVMTFLNILVISFKHYFFDALFNGSTLNWLLISAVFIFWQILLMDGDRNECDHAIARGITGSQLSVLLAGAINIWHPVSDVIYYIGIFLCYLGLFTTLIRIIRTYNLLITRPIPEFHNRGEEE